MCDMAIVSIRINDGKSYAYLQKRRAKPSQKKGERISWYLGPVNETTIAYLVEIISELMNHVSCDEPGSRIKCPICNTPVSKLGIEDLVAKRLYEQIKEMEKRDEDIYKVEEYETLKLIVASLTK